MERGPGAGSGERGAGSLREEIRDKVKHDIDIDNDSDDDEDEDENSEA